MAKNETWFARHKTLRRMAWAAFAVAVALIAIYFLGEGFVRAVIVALARKFDVEIEVPAG